MPVFYLYRIKIERDPQRTIFDDQDASSSELIRRVLEEKPSRETRRHQFWRIGNLTRVSERDLFFAFGRTSKSNVELFDEESGNFVEQPQEQAPFTYVAIDLENQICAIAHKSKVSPTIKSIASNLAKLLNLSSIAQEQNFSFSIPSINDPSEFITILHEAFSIKSFEMSFSLPNPFDVERQFHRPMEQLLEASHADQGKTRIEGASLDTDVVENLARSAASTGNDAKARVQPTQDAKTELKRIGGNVISVESDELATDDEKKTLFDRLREAYQRVRGEGVRRIFHIRLCF